MKYLYSVFGPVVYSLGRAFGAAGMIIGAVFGIYLWARPLCWTFDCAFFTFGTGDQKDANGYFMLLLIVYCIMTISFIASLCYELDKRNNK